MEIIKAHKNIHGHLYIMVDEKPKLTYEKVGMSYAGSDEQGLFSKFLRYQYGYGNFKAFAGREFSIELKDGSVVKLKDHWWDSGVYDKEHEYIGIGIATLESLQDCYVYYSQNIRKDKLEELLEDYLKRDKFYEYYEIQEWCRLQYIWHPLVFHGKRLPLLMNYKGDLIEEDTKKHRHAMYNVLKTNNKLLRFFKLQYHDGHRLIKLEDNYFNVAKETLPSEEYEKFKLRMKG